MSKTIISYNINGIRAGIKKDLVQWINNGPYDIICFQETKATKEQVELQAFEDMGYHINWHAAEKKGYSGVATFSKIAPSNVVIGCGIERIDKEGRIIRTDFGEITLLNCYFPSGTTGGERQDFKMEFLDAFFIWIAELKKERPNLIIVGDYNIAHTEIDIHNPKSNKKTSGFLPEEREWMTKWFESGFADAFRQVHPEKVEYSWWSYRAGARAKNKGWRIDYQSVSDPIKDRILNAHHLNEAVHSDHCPVFMEIDLTSLV